jgi:hypothetical protein
MYLPLQQQLDGSKMLPYHLALQMSTSHLAHHVIYQCAPGWVRLPMPMLATAVAPSGLYRLHYFLQPTFHSFQLPMWRCSPPWSGG